MPRQATDHGCGRLRNGRELSAQLGQGEPGTDIREDPQLDRVDQTLKNVAEQLDLHIAEAAGGRQEQRRDMCGGLGAFLRGPRGNRRLDLVGDQ